MTAIKNIPDKWLEQEDVRLRIESASSSEDEWTKVFEIRNSYVEHFCGIFLPMASLRAVKSMHDPSWGDDFDRTRGKIAEVRISHTHYLGLRFRRFLGLNLATNGYFQDGKLIARRKVQDGDTQKSDTIFVRSEAVLNLVHGTKQVLLWCVRSQRFSERELKEFGLQSRSDWRRQERYHYVFERMHLNATQKSERPRMATMTQVFGKGLFKLANA